MAQAVQSQVSLGQQGFQSTRHKKVTWQCLAETEGYPDAAREGSSDDVQVLIICITQSTLTQTSPDPVCSFGSLTWSEQSPCKGQQFTGLHSRAQSADFLARQGHSRTLGPWAVLQNQGDPQILGRAEGLCPSCPCPCPGRPCPSWASSWAPRHLPLQAPQ